MTVKEILTWAHEYLIPTSESARLDAELLLSHVLKKPLTFLFAHDETEIGFFKLHKYRRLISQRKEGMPVAYLVGHREFYALDFEINKHVLVPRPDTEILVDCVVSYLQRNDDTTKRRDDILLLDIGTGSACIPISILKNVSDIFAVATDISRPALRCARRNIKKHGMKGRIQLFSSDLIKNVPREFLQNREVIVTANLPYIPTQFQIDPSTKFEPDVALYGGEDGLDIYKRLVEELADIKPRAMFFECFEFQVATLAAIFPEYSLKTVHDMSGKAKMMMLEREDF